MQLKNDLKCESESYWGRCRELSLPPFPLFSSHLSCWLLLSCLLLDSVHLEMLVICFSFPSPSLLAPYDLPQTSVQSASVQFPFLSDCPTLRVCECLIKDKKGLCACYSLVLNTYDRCQKGTRWSSLCVCVCVFLITLSYIVFKLESGLWHMKCDLIKLYLSGLNHCSGDISVNTFPIELHNIVIKWVFLG